MLIVASIAAVAVAASVATAAPAKKQDTTLNGAGATFPFPLISKWIPALGSAYGITVNYSPIGSSVVGSEYAKFESPPLDWPAAVKVGQSGTVATLITYADSRFALTTGKRTISYEIKADSASATTAIANIITRSYDRVALLATETMSYRITENGVLTPVLLDVQFSTTSTLHLIYTPKPK